jgi:hypothetical protein
MLNEFELVVFPRQGAYKPPLELRQRIHVLRSTPLRRDFFH